MFLTVWKLQTHEEKRAFLLEAAQVLRGSYRSGDPDYVGVAGRIALAGRIRVVALKTMAVDQLIPFLQRAIQVMDGTTLTRLLRMIYLHSSKLHAQVECLYTELGEDADALTERAAVGDEDFPAKSRDDFITAMTRMLEANKIDQAGGLLLLSAIAIGGVRCWREPAAQATEGLLAELRANHPVVIAGSSLSVGQGIETEQNFIVPPTARTESVAAKTATVMSKPASADQGLTEFDRVITDRIITLFAQHESTDASERSIATVDELLAIAPLRKQSCFHMGFVDALAAAPCEPSPQCSNHERQSWYLVGYVVGFARSHEADDVMNFLCGFGWPLVQSMYSHPSGSAAKHLLNVITPVFMKTTRTDAILKLLKAAGRHEPALHVAALVYTLQRPHSMDFERTRLVMSTIDVGTLRKIDALETGTTHAFEYHILLGDLERFSGRLMPAKRAYEAALHAAKSEEQRSLVTLNSLLVDCVVSSWDQLVVTDQNRQNWLDCARRHSVALGEMLAAQKAQAEAALVAAFLTLVRPGNPILSMDRAVKSLVEFASEVRIGTIVGASSATASRMESYAAILTLLSGNHAGAGIATDELARWMQSCDSRELPPITTVVSSLQMAVATEASTAVKLAAAIMDRYHGAALRDLPVGELAAQSPAVSSVARNWLGTRNSGLRPRERFTKAVELLRGLLRAPGVDRDEATACIDLLREIANEESSCAEPFIEFMQASDKDIASVMTEEERAAAQLGLLQSGPDTSLTIATAIQLMRYAAQRSEGAYLSDLVELVDEQGGADLVPENYRRMVDRSIGTAVAPAQRKEAITLAFVGGNEIQRQYESRVRDNVLSIYPRVSLWFEYPGWSSNWNVELQTVLAQIRQRRPKVLVLSPFVRTQFGRTLRAKLGQEKIQWRACTGKGAASITRALLGAVAV